MRATGFLTGTVALGLLLAGSLAAQQAAAPKDATGQCTDSTYTTAKTQARACLKHGGADRRQGRGQSCTGNGAGNHSRAGPGQPDGRVGQPLDQGIPLSGHQVLRGHQAREVHVGGGCQGGGIPSVVRQGMQLRPGAG
jgi:hypothetical protein